MAVRDQPLWMFEAEKKRRESAEKVAQIESPLDKLQRTLDVAGMTPVLGASVDLINAAISAGRGKKLEAGLSLASAIPGLGLVSGAGKIAKKAKGIKAGKNIAKEFKPLKAKDAIQNRGRDVVLVEMKTPKGKTFVQPFYKSSGSSVEAGVSEAQRLKRKDVWEPFLGYDDASGWYRKGEELSPGKIKLAREHIGELMDKGFTYGEANPLARIGSYKDVSKEISRLDEMGYFDKAIYENVSGKRMDKFLKEQGVNIPEFKKGGKISNNKVFSYLKNV